jgi:ribonucleoside-diphosphate reductase alpha chain
MLKDDTKETEKKTEEKVPANGVVSANGKHKVFHFEHSVEPLPAQRSGSTISKRTPLGTVHTTSNHDEHGEPFEVFITIGKAGSDLQADAEAIGRLVSLLLRVASPLTRRERLQLVISQLEGIGGAHSVGMGPNRVLSLPDALAATLRDMYFPKDDAEQLPLPELSHFVADIMPGASTNSKPRVDGKLSGADLCPQCGMGTFIRSEGCRKCLSCGYSEC